MKKKRFQYRKKVNKMALRLILSAILLVCCIGCAAFLLVFHIKEVEIIGNTRNTEQEIKDTVMTGPFATNSLLLSMTKKEIKPKDLAFVESVKVERVSAHKVRIHVNEKQIVGYVRFLDCNMYFDKDGVVVESEVAPEASDILEADTVEPEEIIAPEEVVDENETTFHAAVTDVAFITGLQFDHVAIDQKLPIEDENVFNTILGIARIVEKYEILPDRVEFDEKEAMTFYYGDIRVMLGEDNLLEEKITRVAAILPKLSGKSGVLHMEDYDSSTVNIVFTEDITQSDTQDDIQDDTDDIKTS